MILTLERTYELKKNPKNRIARAVRTDAQLPVPPPRHRQRLHRSRARASATAASLASRSAPGSAGTLGGGRPDQDTCSPKRRSRRSNPTSVRRLTDGGRGQHRIEGIGDKMCTLIHNVLDDRLRRARSKTTTAVKGLKVIHDAPQILVGTWDLQGQVATGHDRPVRRLGPLQYPRRDQDGEIFASLGPDDNVVTIATDGFDRYDSRVGRS
ncbi:MAG: hypothetical protein MZU97_20735 [Bacillus subtilis]|nr:hypothetical protein [Bacillus subtilis]